LPAVASLRAGGGIEGGLDWTEMLAVSPDNPSAHLADELLISVAHPGNNARAGAFVAQGGGCDATFFNYRHRLWPVLPARTVHEVGEFLLVPASLHG
jgi:hypothetical protein